MNLTGLPELLHSHIGLFLNLPANLPNEPEDLEPELSNEFIGVLTISRRTRFSDITVFRSVGSWNLHEMQTDNGNEFADWDWDWLETVTDGLRLQENLEQFTSYYPMWSDGGNYTEPKIQAKAIADKLNQKIRNLIFDVAENPRRPADSRLFFESAHSRRSWRSYNRWLEENHGRKSPILFSFADTHTLKVEDIIDVPVKTRTSRRWYNIRGLTRADLQYHDLNSPQYVRENTSKYALGVPREDDSIVWGISFQVVRLEVDQIVEKWELLKDDLYAFARKAPAQNILGKGRLKLKKPRVKNPVYQVFIAPEEHIPEECDLCRPQKDILWTNTNQLDDAIDEILERMVNR